MSKQFVISHQVFYFAILLLAFGTFYPMIHNYVFFGELKRYVTIGTILLWSLIVVATRRGQVIIPNKTFNITMGIQTLFLITWSFFVSSMSVLGVALQLALSWFFVFLFLNSIKKDFFLKTFIRLNILSLFLCVIGLALVVTNAISVYSVHPYHDDMQIYNYLFFFIKRQDFADINLRPAGYYDEPGSFAYVVMFLLIINRKFYNNRRWELLLLLLPLVTTSMAHIVTSLTFILLFYTQKKHFSYIIVVLLILSTIYYLFLQSSHGDYTDYFRGRTIGRVSGVLAGSDESRRGGFELGPVIFLRNITGTSPEHITATYPQFVPETLWAPLIYYGIQGVGIYFLLIIVSTFKLLRNKTRENISFIILLGMNLVQRPNYMYPLYILLIYLIFFTDPPKQPKPIRKKRVISSQQIEGV